jgi:hypothetical protein
MLPRHVEMLCSILEPSPWPRDEQRRHVSGAEGASNLGVSCDKSSDLLVERGDIDRGGGRQWCNWRHTSAATPLVEAKGLIREHGSQRFS